MVLAVEGEEGLVADQVEDPSTATGPVPGGGAGESVRLDATVRGAADELEMRRLSRDLCGAAQQREQQDRQQRRRQHVDLH